jgi:hypothetical protein
MAVASGNRRGGYFFALATCAITFQIVAPSVTCR